MLKALKPPREFIRLWHRCSNSENGGMVSLPVLQNCNHFRCSYDRIFKQSFVCVHFSSIVHQCERLKSSCSVVVIITAFTAGHFFVKISAKQDRISARFGSIQICRF